MDKKHALPGRQSLAYLILGLIAISGELPTNQITRLKGGNRYKEKVIKELKSKKLIYTFKKDKLCGYRLTAIAKKLLLLDNHERFTFCLTGKTETNLLKSESARRLRLHRIAETLVTMYNAGVRIFKDDKPDIFSPTAAQSQAVTVPTFYNSREVRELGMEAIKISGSRMTGVLLTESDIYVVYNTGDTLMKWSFESEVRAQVLMLSLIRYGRLSSQYRVKDIHGIILSDNMEIALQMFALSDKKKRSILNNCYDKFHYITNDCDGETQLKILCDPNISTALDSILSDGLRERNPKSIIENDAFDENGEPVLFAYNLDMMRVKRFNISAQHHKRSGMIYCFEFQTDILRQFCCDTVQFTSIKTDKVREKFFVQDKT